MAGIDDGLGVTAYWMSEIEAARKREADYRKHGEEVLRIYSAEDDAPYNILYSNTETMLPALYSAVPRPVVKRRFKDESQVGTAAAMTGQRVLEFLLDTNIDGYESYDEAMHSAVLDALLPGRGVTRVKYDARISGETKTSELVCMESVHWDRFLMGYAKKWSKVPWIAYEEHVSREEAVRLFGEDVAGKMTFSADQDITDAENKSDRDKNQGGGKTALVYQIWDREGGKDGERKVRYVSPQYTDGYLKVFDDPLGLTGFYNCPMPLRFISKPSDLKPIALYRMYEAEARQLNRITTRIRHIVNAIKARGIYDSELGDEIANLMKAEENELVPADKSSSLAAEKGLSNAIWFMPIEQLVNVLDKLIGAREQCKRVIYEVTGISDLLRGSTAASETATAQTLKNQWGTLRLKRAQKEVQRYARDLLRMMLEVAASKFSVETFAAMTGLPYPMEEYKQQIEMAASQARGQPLPPQAQQILESPSWEQVAQLLGDDTQRAFKIDIETNSTVEPEAVEDQKNIAELMNALAQYLNGVAPLVESGMLPFEAAQSMLLAITKRFAFGAEVEEYVKEMRPPEKPQEDDGQAAMAEVDGKLQIAQRQTEANIMASQRQTDAAIAEAQKKADNDIQLKWKHANADIEIESFKAIKAAEREKASADAKSGLERDVTGIDGERSELAASHEQLAAALSDITVMMQGMAQGVAENAQTMQVIQTMMMAPRTIVRDKQKRLTGIQVEGMPMRSVARDETGLVSGLN